MISVDVLILGASGYGGGELLRWLSMHPAVASLRGTARSHAGLAFHAQHPHLRGLVAGTFEAEPDWAAWRRAPHLCCSRPCPTGSWRGSGPRSRPPGAIWAWRTGSRSSTSPPTSGWILPGSTAWRTGSPRAWPGPGASPTPAASPRPCSWPSCPWPPGSPPSWPSPPPRAPRVPGRRPRTPPTTPPAPTTSAPTRCWTTSTRPRCCAPWPSRAGRRP